MIRVWAVTAVTPVARVLEGLRGGSSGFLRNYILLHDADDENRRLREENGRLKLENIFLKNELNRADRAKALQAVPGAHALQDGGGEHHHDGRGLELEGGVCGSRVGSGVQRGMAVVTPGRHRGEGDCGLPTASEVLLITDPDFAAGVISQKTQVRGTLKGQGTPLCKVDYVPFEEKVEPGDWFYTSGDDRVFPRGFPVGVGQVGAPRAAVPGDSGGTRRAEARAGGCADPDRGRAPGDSGSAGQPTSPSTSRLRRRLPMTRRSPTCRPGRPARRRTSCARCTSRWAKRRTTHSARASPASRPPDFTKLPVLGGRAPGATGQGTGPEGQTVGSTSSHASGYSAGRRSAGAAPSPRPTPPPAGGQQLQGPPPGLRHPAPLPLSLRRSGGPIRLPALRAPGGPPKK